MPLALQIEGGSSSGAAARSSPRHVVARDDQDVTHTVRGRDGPESILVGVDGSPTSMRAAAYAGGLARRQDATLLAVVVLVTPVAAALVLSADGWVRQWHDELCAELTAQYEEGVRRLPGLRSELVIVTGDPYRQLVQIADQRRADAVVVGASAQLGHRFVGSLAGRLVRAGKWPVTVVP